MNFDFSTPYSSARLPQFARNIVSTSHPLAAQAGLRMMLKGGNAVDAAIAAAAAITITEPVSNGLGSDAFCILWDGQKLHGLSIFTTSTAKMLSIRPSEVGTLSRCQAPSVLGLP